MAAIYQVAPPEPFNFGSPQEWPKWARRFERFRTASGLSAKGEEVQVNTLIYSMGDEADDILRSFQLSEEDKRVYNTVKSKFDAHFVKKRNVIFERAKFNMRKQDRGESVDSFITDLYALAEYCGYGPLHDEMIRDRLVVGICDASLSEKLQLDPDLTLAKALTKVRQAEAVKQQQPVLRGDERVSDVPVGEITHDRKQKPRNIHRPQAPLPSRSYGRSSTPKACFWCGDTPPHGRLNCPAKEATCGRCGKKGHYTSVCRYPVRVGEVQEDTSDVFLGNISGTGRDPWKVDVQLGGQTVTFHIDTGAEVTVIPQRILKQIGVVSLQPSNRTLRGPNQSILQVTGQFNAKMCVKSGRETSQEIYVVRPAIAALRLVARVGAVEKDGCTDATEPDLENLFPQLFTGLGNLEGEYAIKLREDVKPFAITTPRRVPIPLMPAVQEELARMEKLGVISKVEEPTDWCAGMVVVPKPDGRVRICVDLVRLNESVCREYHQMPTVEQVLAQVPGARIFSKLDANSGFWQVPLSKESALLTTFSTPFGRYHFNRLPFGITSASEHFQRKMSAILEGLDGVVGLVDDVLVHGKDRREHDERLLAALRRLVQARLTLNKEKCSFFQTKVKFLGQILSGSGIESDPEKTAAITKFKEPANVSETRRFLGMVNQLSKFVPHLADMTKPLRDLLSKKNSWSWESPQQEAFQAVKQALTESPILALYDPSLETTVTADASSYGLGAVLRQKQADGITRPVAYVSRSMTPTEERYAQIEKEALALTWACERFSDYLIGLHFCVETDHKPLVPLFSQKLLDELPIRIQRFRMRMMRFSFSICHVPGKELATADALSRAPIDVPNSADHLLQDECDAYVQYAIQCLPATEKRLDEIKSEQEKDEICREVVGYCNLGWPEKSRLYGILKKYHSVSAELSV